MAEAKIHTVNTTKYPADKADKWSALPLAQSVRLYIFDKKI
jgi:hypothetical protein